MTKRHESAWEILHEKLYFWQSIYLQCKVNIKFLGGATKQNLLLFETLWNLPESRPFLSAQMAVLSSFFQVFIVLGMYNFGVILTLGVVSQELKWTFRCMRFHCLTVLAWFFLTQPTFCSTFDDLNIFLKKCCSLVQS